MMSRLFRLTPLLFLLSANACGGDARNSDLEDQDVEPSGLEQGGGVAGVGSAGSSPSEGSGGEPGVGAAGAGGVPADLVFGGVEEFCEKTCAIEPLGTGSCAKNSACEENEPEGCLASAARWNSEARTAYEYCVENDPLCFVGADGCVVEVLRNGASVPVEITVTGLAAHEGLAWKWRVSDVSASGIVTDGTVGVAFASDKVLYDIPLNTSFWVDADDSGDCNADGDVLYHTTADWNGSFENIRWTVMTDAPVKGFFSEQSCSAFE